MIARSVVAHCDWEGCDVTQDLSPDSIQVFRDLVKLGWAVTSLNHKKVAQDITIYCPKHLEMAAAEEAP